MLVLTRRSGERIQLGEEIRITVVSVKGGKVRIGIEAPSNLLILREELVDRSQPAFEVSLSSPVRPTAHFPSVELESHALLAATSNT